MKPANPILLIVVFVVNIFCVCAQNDPYNALTISDDLKKNANAVMRLDQRLITVESRDEAVIYEKRIVTVLNEKGDGYVLPVAYYDNSSKITKLYAKIYDAFGKEVKKIKEKNFSDRARIDGDLYSDSRYKVMAYTPVSYPYTVEFVSETKTKNTASLPGWYPVKGYYVSTERSEYQITCPEELGLRSKGINFEGHPIKNLSKNSGLKYEASDMMAVLPEDYSPSFSVMFPRLMVTTSKFHVDGVDGDVSDWNDMGIWMNTKILLGRDELSEATKRYVRRLVKNIDNPIEKARKIVEYVQENTRYISVQVGIGGIQPIAASEVDKVKYGDCKGLTNYTKSLLESVGVPSYYTVVESGNSKAGLQEDFASLAQGDHIILCIPTDEKNVFMDCTSQIHPFGFIGDFTDDRNVLIIKPDGGEIVKTTSYLNEENYQLTKANAVINENGAVTATVTIVTEGTQYDSRFIIDRLSPDEQKTYYKKYWRNINNINLKKIEHLNDKDKVQFTQNVVISFDNYVAETSDKLLLTVNMFNNGYPVPTRYRNRKFPLEISRGFLDEDEYRIEIPKSYSISSLPAPVKISNEFGTYEMYCEKTDDNHIIFKRKFAIKEGLHDKESYGAFRTFIKKASKSDNSKAVLIKKT